MVRRNPEDGVIDAIDELVDWQLTRSDAAKRERLYGRCGAAGLNPATGGLVFPATLFPDIVTAPLRRALAVFIEIPWCGSDLFHEWFGSDAQP